MSEEPTYTLTVHDEDDGMLWAEVLELPGCFASGADMDELLEATAEAIALYLADSSPQNVVPMGARRRTKTPAFAVPSLQMQLREPIAL